MAINPYDDLLERVLGRQPSPARPAESAAQPSTPAAETPSPSLLEADGERATPAGCNPYDDLLDRTLHPQDRTLRGQETRLRVSVIHGSEVSPEDQARGMELARRMGLPSALVFRNLEDIKRRALVTETEGTRRLPETPATAAWLSEPEHGKLAHERRAPTLRNTSRPPAWPRTSESESAASR
jgi:hypothetical protein